MKTLLRMACLGLVLGAGAAEAATPLETLRRKVAKYASTELNVYKSLCVCTDPASPHDGRVGRVRYAMYAPQSNERALEAWCQISLYDASDGDPVAGSACNTFQPLAS